MGRAREGVTQFSCDAVFLKDAMHESCRIIFAAFDSRADRPVGVDLRGAKAHVIVQILLYFIVMTVLFQRRTKRLFILQSSG